MCYYSIDMKKYYSPTKEFYTRKRHRFCFRLFKTIVRVFFPRDEFIWSDDRPNDDEPFIFVGNHTKVYAPLTFLLNYDKKIRPWSSALFLYPKEALHHIFQNIIPSRKPKILLYPLAILMLPLIVWIFHSIEPIPVYKQSKRIFDTFDKAIQTLNEEVHQIVFAEKLHTPANDYIFELNRGFTYIGKSYYERTGKKIKYYPVYTCQVLHKVLIGEPVEYDPEVHMSIQKETICKHLEENIGKLGDSLPKHKISIYE